MPITTYLRGERTVSKPAEVTKNSPRFRTRPEGVVPSC